MSFARFPTTLWQRIRTGKRGLAAALLLFLASGEARAHVCDSSPISLVVGSPFVYRIYADVIESLPSGYAVTAVGDPAVARIVTPGSFLAFGFGAWAFVATGVGVTSFTFQWDYVPMMASGSCTVMVDIAQGSQVNATQANYDRALQLADPINTFTGEFHFVEDIGFDLGGPMPLELQFFYGSSIKSDSFVTSRVGTGWAHNFDLSLIHDTTADEIFIAFERGRILSFSKPSTVWVLDNPTDIPYQLVESGVNFVLLDPRTHRMFTFDDQGRLIQIADGQGNTHTLTHTDLLLDSVSDGLGRTLTFTYAGLHNLSSVSDGTRSITLSHVFTGFAPNLTGMTDARGNTTTYTYDATNISAALMTSRMRAEGNTTTTQVYTNGQVTSQTDALSNTTTLAYGANSTTATDPLAQDTTHDYAATGEATGVEDPGTTSFTMSYDADGRRTGVTSREGNATAYTYHAASGKIATITEADGGVTTLSYTSRVLNGLTLWDLTGISHADGTTESFVYDANGNLSSATDQAGGAWTYTYNGRGQVLTSTNPELGVTTRTYNADGTLASYQNPAAHTTTFGYDSLLRRTTTTHPDTSTVTATYDANDNVLTETNSIGSTTTFTFDMNDNTKTVLDAAGNTSTLNYDGLDRFASIQNRVGNTSSETRDALGRLANTTNGNGNVTTLGYNSRGYLTSVTNPESEVSTQAFDLEGILTSSSDPLGHTTLYQADDLGRYTQITSPLSNTRTLTYDLMGRLSTITDPLGNTSTYNYESRGMLSGIMMPEGIAATYTRNGLGQVETVTDPRGFVWSFGYDSAGLRTSATDPLSNTTTYSYDNRSRVSGMNFPGGGTLAITYDNLGNVTQRSYSDATTLTYGYDSLARLTSATGMSRSFNAAGEMTDSNGIGITRDAGGRIASVTLALGKTITYQYDMADRVTQIADFVGGNTTFSYDMAGRLQTITRPNGVSTTYTYDDEDNLSQVVEGAVGTITLSRDAKGQILTANRMVEQGGSLPMGVENFSYDDASQVLAFTYDTMGRVTDDGTRTYTWDLAGRPTQMVEGMATTTYAYDAMSHRISRTVGAVTTDYVWNYAMNIPVISVESVGAVDQRYYVHTPDGSLLHSIDASDDSRLFYHYDEMGNTIGLTDDMATTAAAYAYSPYGTLVGSQGSVPNPFTFQGERGAMDEGGGVYYMRNRYYYAAAARFISRDRDPSLGPRGVNPYSYALGNPLGFRDPDGLTPRTQAEMNTQSALDELQRNILPPGGELRLRRVPFSRGRSDSDSRSNSDSDSESYSDSDSGPSRSRSRSDDDTFTDRLITARRNIRRQGERAGKKVVVFVNVLDGGPFGGFSPFGLFIPVSPDTPAGIRNPGGFDFDSEGNLLPLNLDNLDRNVSGTQGQAAASVTPSATGGSSTKPGAPTGPRRSTGPVPSGGSIYVDPAALSELNKIGLEAHKRRRAAGE